MRRRLIAAASRVEVIPRRFIALHLSVVAFQPQGVKLKKGQRYWVAIDGIRRKDGTPQPFRWLVEYF